MKIVNRKINELIKADYNPRKISDKDFEQLKKSLETFECVEPIVVNQFEGRENIIVGGHQRLKAMDSLGWKEVPTIEVNLNLEQEKELNVRLNKNTGEFDFELLTDLFDIETLESIGFELDDLPDITEDLEQGLTDPDDAPEPPKDPKTKLGDIYELGNHRLMCGDSTSIDAVEKLMDGEKADMIFTDPPYGGDLLSYTNNPKSKFQNAINKVSSNTNFMSKFNPKDLLAVLSWMDAPSSYVFTDLTLLKDYIFKNSKVLVWDKKIGMPSVGNYNSNIEFIVFTKKQGALFNNGIDGVKYGRVITMAKKDRDLHPTMKPIELIKNCIKISSNKYNLIVDLFLGSGSTLIASEKLNRKCYGMELDPKYCDVIVERWENFTGKKAKLLNQEVY